MRFGVNLIKWSIVRFDEISTGNVSLVVPSGTKGLSFSPLFPLPHFLKIHSFRHLNSIKDLESSQQVSKNCNKKRTLILHCLILFEGNVTKHDIQWNPMRHFISNLKSCSLRSATLLKKRPQVFSCEFCEISKNTFCYRTLLVAASVASLCNDFLHSRKTFPWFQFSDLSLIGLRIFCTVGYIF